MEKKLNLFINLKLTVLISLKYKLQMKLSIKNIVSKCFQRTLF